MTLTTDFLIIGAGIIGLSVARAIQRRHPDARVVVAEKEPAPGQHASGRNSGVLHSGIYYTADTLKARFTRDGNRAWQAYCEERQLPLERCGKLVLARTEADWSGLTTLAERGQANGVAVQWLDAQALRALEPRAQSHEKALFVPSTATVDPLRLVRAQQAELVAAGGRLLCGAPYRAHYGRGLVQVGAQRISAGFVVNCAGLYADRVARDFGFGQGYSIVPFKGLYLYANSAAPAPRCHLYPVPDLRNPFLGVHVTRTLTGAAKIGPTAIPAFWREQYGGWRGFNLPELFDITARELRMLLSNQAGFRQLAWQEIRKQRRGHLIAEAGQLLQGIDSMGFQHWGQPGIRAQLVERATNRLVMDFVIEGDDRSLHVLNAVSPALTCALPFAAYLVDNWV